MARLVGALRLRRGGQEAECTGRVASHRYILLHRPLQRHPADIVSQLEAGANVRRSVADC